MSRKLDAEIAQKLYGWAIIEGRGRRYLMPSPCLDVDNVSWETSSNLEFWYPRELLPKFSTNRAAAEEALSYLYDNVDEQYDGEANLNIRVIERETETEVKFSVFCLTAYNFDPNYEKALCYSILEILEAIKGYESGEDMWREQTDRKN